jgi:hypothetical protein
VFALTVISAIVGIIALGGWAYDEFLKKSRLPTTVTTVAPGVGFLQLGADPWFRPQKFVSDNLSVSLWLRNKGDTPVEGEVHYFEADIAPLEQDLQVQEQKLHAKFLANALRFNADQIEEGFVGRPIGKGEGVWQTMTFPHLTQETIDGILKGHARIFVYAWSRWRDAPHDLDLCLYLQRPENLELKDNSLMLCSDAPVQTK